MKDLSEILQTLEDFEIAYLIKHRLNEFMESSKNKIIFEFLKRGYDQKDAENILKKKNNQPKTINSKY